jgi:phosphoglycolate phosphatase-like HAD superfamily hydrolase
MKDIIFDIDGTLADIQHRIHHIKEKPKSWRKFREGILDDTPHTDIFWLLHTFHSVGCRILIASGRSEYERDLTAFWLYKHGIKGKYEKLYMRARDDYRGDYIIKKEILEEMRRDGYNPTMAIDDRDQVVNMWRENGIRCLQCAEGKR